MPKLKLFMESSMTDLIEIRKSSLSFSNAFLNNEKRPHKTEMRILVYFYFVHTDNNPLAEGFYN